MSIDFEMRFDFAMLNAQLQAAAPIALARAAEVVRGVAVARTPNDTGHLAGKAGVTVVGAGVDAVAEVKYGGPYAAYQNRGMTAQGTKIIRRRPAGGQTGFLTETMVDQKQAATDMIADTLRQLMG